jgi:CheY-like chemotaxis protein
MPEMDGYQATAKLRADARFCTLPIIAMTAHATVEERQRCLAAGMNDHISKPIDPVMLFATVGRFYQPLGLRDGEEAGGHRVLARGNDVPSMADLDTQDGLSRVAGNRTLYLRLLRQFVEQQGAALEEIATALTQGDAALAERLAHTLKGVAGNIGAKTVQAAAGALEKLIRTRAAAAEVDSAKEQIAAALNPLVAGLRAVLCTPEPGHPAQTMLPPAANPAECRESAAQLARLLAQFDPVAGDFLEANQAALRPLFADEKWAVFAKLVQDYAFAEAEAQLEQALKNLPRTQT